MGRYWVQADCVLIEADDPGAAIAEYRRLLAAFHVACSTGQHCDALYYTKATNPEQYGRLMAKQERGIRDNVPRGMDT